MKTVSLELAKQLKEAGIEIKTYFAWFIIGYDQGPDAGPIFEETALPINNVTTDGQIICPAPATDELLEWLPEGVSITKDVHCRVEFKIRDIVKHFVDDIPADALAKLALWVSENRLKGGKNDDDKG